MAIGKNAILGVALLLAFAWQAQAQLKLGTYSNTRFGYQFQYPTEIFSPLSEADNGELLFSARHGELRVSVRLNVLGDKLKETFDSEIRRIKGIKGKIDHRNLLESSYVISGRIGGKMFYQKTIIKGHDGDTAATLATLRIEYVTYGSPAYGPVFERIGGSFVFN